MFPGILGIFLRCCQIVSFFPPRFLSVSLDSVPRIRGWETYLYNIFSKFDVRKSVQHHTIRIIQPTKCNSFTSLLLDVYVWLSMFRASPHPSSGAYNCTSSLWFYRWREAVGVLLVVVWQTTTNIWAAFLCGYPLLHPYFLPTKNARHAVLSWNMCSGAPPSCNSCYVCTVMCIPIIVCHNKLDSAAI
jgi:hypothetical protein